MQNAIEIEQGQGHGYAHGIIHRPRFGSPRQTTHGYVPVQYMPPQPGLMISEADIQRIALATKTWSFQCSMPSWKVELHPLRPKYAHFEKRTQCLLVKLAISKCIVGGAAFGSLGFQRPRRIQLKSHSILQKRSMFRFRNPTWLCPIEWAKQIRTGRGKLLPESPITMLGTNC